MKKFKLPLLVSLASIVVLGTSSCSNNLFKWYYSEEDTRNFSNIVGAIKGPYTGAEYIVDYDSQLFTEDINIDDVIVFDIYKAEKALEESDKDYADYSIIKGAAVETTAVALEEDNTRLVVSFTSGYSGDFGMLINKRAVLSNTFAMVQSEEDDVDLEGNDIDPQTAWEENYAKDNNQWNTGAKTIIQVLQGIGLIVAGALSTTVNPVGIVTGIFTIGTSIGDLFGNNGPTIANVMSKLNDLDSKITDISKQMEINHEQLLKQELITSNKVDTLLLKQAEEAITAFSTDYLKDIDDYNANFGDELGKALKNYVQESRIIDMNLFKSDKGEWCYRPIISPTVGDTQLMLKVNSFPKALAFLKSSNNVVKNGFVDALMEDIKDAASGLELKDGLTPELVSQFATSVIYESLSKEYYQNNYQAAASYRNKMVGYAKRFNGVYSTSILNSYLSRLEYMYNFAGEIKSTFTSLVANFKSYLDFNVARAMEACEFAEIDYTELETNYKSARQAMTNTYLSIDNLAPNYSFITGTNIGGNFYRAGYSTSYSNPGNHCTLNVNFNLYRFKYDDSTGWINMSSALFSGINTVDLIDVNAIHSRYACIQSFDERALQYDYIQYLSQYEGSMKNAYTIYTRYLNSKVVDTNSYRIYTGNSERTLNSGDSRLSLYCQNKGNNKDDYFDCGSYYNYRGKHDGDKWYGVLDTTTYVSGTDGTNTKNGIVAAWARYAEDHWYWRNDEYWSFVDNPSGNYFFILENE